MNGNSHPGRNARAPSDWLGWFVEATVAVAAVELIVLRLFTRTIVHIPGAGEISPFLSTVSSAGRFSYYLASVLLTVTLFLLIGALSRASGHAAGAAAVAVFVALATLARAGIVGDLSLALLVCGCVFALAVVAAHARRGWARLPVLLFAVGFLLSGLYAALQSPVAAELYSTRTPTLLLFGGETLALSAALASPLLLARRPARSTIAVGAGVAVLCSAALVANPSTTKILLLWNFGLAGYFPSIVYGAALGAITITVIGLARQAKVDTAIAVALVAMGGIGLHSTYQSALVVAGLGLLALTGRTSASCRALSPSIAPRARSTTKTRSAAAAGDQRAAPQTELLR
ncbi:MAG TPA: hypothetical protein VFD59_20505 [Nocardioidaceae bacterium]|nr:hypothetical protein [Nocardioidaceae bacterium]